MKTWRIACAVKDVWGTQWFTVRARTRKEALAKHKAGKSEFADEEIEVTDLEDPDESEIEEVELGE